LQAGSKNPGTERCDWNSSDLTSENLRRTDWGKSHLTLDVEYVASNVT